MNQREDIRLDKTEGTHRQIKINCPICKKKRRYVRFYNYTTNSYLEDIYGRCDREHGCGYFYSPYQDLKENRQPQTMAHPKPEERKYKTVPPDTVKASLKAYNRNNLFTFLISKASIDQIAEAFAKYHVGTSKIGGTVFWQRDMRLQFNTAQVIHYLTDGHRDKQKPPSRVFTVSDGYKTCIFGEHLLFQAKTSQMVCIVESEKTALICSIWLPVLNDRECIWIASVGTHGITDEKIGALKGFDICLVPDFSFHARATWGVLPMRKKKVKKVVNDREVETRVIDKDGELDPEYISLKDRLKKQGNKVSFLNPFPDLEDGSDIADVLLQMPAPKYIELPDFDSLKLEINTPSINSFRTKRPVDFDWSPPAIFNIVENSDNSFDIHGIEGYAKESVLKKMDTPIFLELVKRFGIIKGTVGPLKT